VSSAERNDWVDALRGIGIFLVVVGHTLRGLDLSGVEDSAVASFLDPRLYAVHVQLLFFVSGLLIARTVSKHGAKQFSIGRLNIILVPMIIWTYIFLLFKVCAGSLQNQTAGTELLMTPPIPGFAHLWFLWALFLISLMFAAFWATASHWRASWKVKSITFFAICIVLSEIPLGPMAHHWFGETLKFAPYLALGIVVSAVTTQQLFSWNISVLSIVAFLVLLLGEPFFRQFFGSQTPVSIALCLTIFCAGRVVIASEILRKTLVLLGIASMAIYVMHTIFSAGIREILMSIGIYDHPTHLLVGIASGIIFPLVVWKLAHQYGFARFLRL